ncbi:hypothetical protein Syun_005820 [Stephania yunnanensis]|uniref:BTB domain-containing protein n=1 Tax=Stephania yunnanensis TaxID=152371 RepID=A0AAP0KYU7_9MAGN
MKSSKRGGGENLGRIQAINSPLSINASTKLSISESSNHLLRFLRLLLIDLGETRCQPLEEWTDASIISDLAGFLIYRCSDDGRKKWECKDIETQKLVVRAIDAFVSCICHDMLRDRLVKDAIGDMLLALEGVFQSENETILGMAANIAVKLVDTLGSSILPFNVLELVSSLSYLVSYPHSSIAASSAVTLNKILVKLTPRRMKIHHDVWEILKQRKVIHSITCGLEDFIVGSKPLEYFIEISSLLKTILLRWPSARYPFWSNATVKGLDTIYSKLDSYSAQVSVLQLYSAQVSVLQLYSSLALCGTVAKKLLENGEAFVLMIVHCMNNSKPHSIRVEAFKLAQCFLKSQECCARMMSLGGKSIITAIIRALSGWRICNGKVPKEQMLLMVEACSLALVTRWPGDHHSLFWELGIDRVLLELLLGHSHQIILLGPTLSMEGVIALALEGINSGHLVGMESDRQTVFNLIALACIPVLPRHHSVIIESENTCCWFDESWEGRNSFLFFSLCGLSELIHHSSFLRNHGEKTSGLVVDDMEIGGSDAHSRLGKRIGKALKEIELADVQFRLVSGETLEVHGVILTARCQSLLPPKPHTSEEIGGGSNEGVNMEQKKFKNEVHLSSRIICQTLKKLLEFVYVGSVKVDAALVKDLRMLAKGCQLHDLLGVLDRKKPKWGRKVEHCNYIAALGPTGYEFSDIILEANEGRSTNSTCSVCTLVSPHVHAHKIILSISSDYMRAMFSSAMQESFAQIIKVPVSWEALSKLMIWFYSDELSRPSSGCLWDNMDVDCQLQQLHPFIELCWLAEFWLLEHIREEALAVVMSHLNSSKELSLKIIVISADLNQLEIVEAAANYLAPSFPHLRDSGDLESLNENLVML